MIKHNYYKLKNIGEYMIKRGNSRGQLAIFVIVAVVIVAVILAVLFYPRIKILVSGEFTPENYLKTCVKPEIDNIMPILNKQGGYANPEGFLVQNGEKIKFLCYTNEYYKTCVVQEPFIIRRYASEIQTAIEVKASRCFSDLKKEYESRGYSVTGGFRDAKVDIDLNGIKVSFNSPVSVTKESTERFNGFNVEIDSKMYEILSIKQNIIEFESVYGDSETTSYLQYYPDLKIEKTKLSDGTKIYKVSNVITKEEFTFASRSLSWPPGYGVIQ